MKPPRTDSAQWRQINVGVPDWTQAETSLATHLAPVLIAAEDEGVLTSWFFICKGPCLRVRYLPAGDASQAKTHLRLRLEKLQSDDHITDLADVVYEPETHAFGGADAMAAAHRFFHRDTRHLLTYLAEARKWSGPDRRRELSIMLCSALLRAAGLDWYEQGDVWARVAEHREPPEHFPANRFHALQDDLQRLMSVDTVSVMSGDCRLAAAAGWVDAFTCLGRELAELAARGQLGRGLRAVLAHQIIFAWNRHGLPITTQAILAHTAKTVVFGCDPAHKTKQTGRARHDHDR